MQSIKQSTQSLSMFSTVLNAYAPAIDFIKETRRLVSRKSQHQRFQIAKRHVINALDFKKLRLDLQLPEVSEKIKMVHSFQTNGIWKMLLLLIAYVFMYISFIGHVNPEYSLVIVQIVMLLFFVLDFGLEIVHKSIKTYLSTTKFHVRFYIRVFVVSLLLIDSIIVLSFKNLPVRPFLILRCVLPIMYDQQLRKLVYALFSSYIDIFVYALFYVAVIICFAVMANQFIEIPEGTQYDSFVQNYGQLPKAIFLMYILTTFDAYPDNQLVGIKIQLWLYGFFIVFIFMNALFFVTIPANVLFNSIIETRSKSVIIDEIQQQNNLIMAFITLGGDSQISIPYDKVIRFLLFIFNNQSRYLDKIMEICRALDQKVNGSIEVNEFMQICKIIHSNNNLRPPRYLTCRKISRLHSRFNFKEFLNSTAFNVVLGVVIILTFFNSIFTMYTDIHIFTVFNDILLFLYMVEVLFKLIALGAEDFFNRYWNTIDLLVISLGFILQVITKDSISNNIAVLIKMVRIFRITTLVEIIGNIFDISFKNRIVTKLAELMNQMIVIIPIILKFFPLYLVTFYFLGVVGVQIYWYEADIPSQLSPYNNYFEFSNFKTLLGTQFIFVQVLTQAGWSMVAFDYAFRYGAYALTMIFFVLCHQIICIILTSLMKGVTWQVYNTINGEHEDFKNKAAEEQNEAKNLKKRLEIFEEIKQKIQKHQYIFPDNLVTRELYEKKIDQEILSRLTELEMKGKGAFFQKRKRSSKLENQKSVDVQPLPIYKSILLLQNQNNHKNRLKSKDQIKNMESSSMFLQIPKKRANEKRSTISRKQMDIQSSLQMGQDSEKNVETVFQNQSQQLVEIEDLKQQDIEREIDGVLSQVELHAGIKFSVKIENPPIFIDYIKKKLKTLRISDFKEDFDINNHFFAKKDSLEMMVHGLQTLLDMQTSEREQKGQILKIMIKKGLISEQKAMKMLTQKSEFESDVSFDYNWIIRKTYLQKMNETKLTQFEIEYFSSIYGKSFKDINKTTVYPLLKLQSQLSYCFNNILRYRQITTNEFFNTLTYIQNKISTKLFQTGSLCKFVFQIDMNSDSWFTVQHKNSNELRVHFIKNGIWLYHNGLKQDEIYAARDIFHFPQIHKMDEDEKEQCQSNIKKLFQTFESLSFCINDFSKFFNPFPQLETYDLFTFFRDVQETKRYVKKPLSISKIMIVLLAKEDERDASIPYSLSDMKFDEDEMESYKKSKQKNIKLDETETEMFEKLKDYEVDEEQLISDREGLPYSYIINFLEGFKETMILNDRNFVYHVEKILNQNFKQEQKLLYSSRVSQRFAALPETI